MSKIVNYLETHYFLNDGSHAIDAFVFNQCQSDLLDIFNEVKKEIGLKNFVKLEIIALEEGGLIQWLQGFSTSDVFVSFEVLIALVSLILSRIPPKETELDKRNKELDIQKKEIEIERLKKELNTANTKVRDDEVAKQINDLTEKYYLLLIQNIIIRKKLSNIYKKLLSESKISSVSYNHYDAEKVSFNRQEEVKREYFSEFLLEIDEFIDIDEIARIHIYSPNLVNRKHKWRGYYEKESRVIEFNMLDKEFIKEIQNQSIDFKNGTMIDAVLHLKIKFDKLGNENSRIYSVSTVLHKIDGEKFIETRQGKNYKHMKKALASQQMLNFDE